MAEEKLIRVRVKVAARENFNGIRAAGRFWPTGETVAEVTQVGLDNLKARDAILVEVLTGGGDGPTFSGGRGPTSDEDAELRAVAQPSKTPDKKK